MAASTFTYTHGVPLEQPWKVLRYLNHGYSVDCGYCHTSWRGVSGSEEAARKFLAEHQLYYCIGREVNHAR